MEWDKMSELERDALVATEIMGWHLHPSGVSWDDDKEPRVFVSTWSPATDIAAAFQVMEKMKTEGWHGAVHTHNNGIEGHPEEWPLACFEKGDMDPYYDAVAKTVEEAICLAALRAKGISI